MSMIISHADEKPTAFDNLESFRKQVIETVKQNWQVVDARASDVDEGTVDLYLRRAHYPISQAVDIRALHRDSLDETPDDRTARILDFFDKKVFRPLSRELVAQAHPIVVGNWEVEQWRQLNPKLTELSFPATAPLSDDASIAFEHGWGTSSILLSNYDFQGLPIERRLDAVKALLDKCSPKVTIQRLPDGLDVLPTLEDFLRGAPCEAPVLSATFWKSVADRYPQGAYVAFPFKKFSVPNTLLIDKRLPNARETLRSNMKLKFPAPSNHIYEFTNGKLVAAE